MGNPQIKNMRKTQNQSLSPIHNESLKADGGGSRSPVVDPSELYKTKPQERNNLQTVYQVTMMDHSL